MKKVLTVLVALTLLVGCQKYDDKINTYQMSREVEAMNKLSGLTINAVKFSFSSEKKNYDIKKIVILIDDEGKITYDKTSSINLPDNSSNILYQGYRENNSGEYELVTYLDNQANDAFQNSIVREAIPKLQDYTDFSVNIFTFDNTILKENSIYVTMMIESAKKNNYYQNNDFVDNGLLDQEKLKKAKVKNLVMVGFSIVESDEFCGC